MENAATYHQRRAKKHRLMAEQSPERTHANIHAKLAELHEAAAERERHSLHIAEDR
jgi:hypothetical protein